MPDVSRRDRRKQRRRAEIYEAALELFAERGYADVSVDDIAAAADVAKGTFFNYFPTKDHLLVEYRNALLDFIHAFGAAQQGDSARALFKAYFRKLTRKIRSEGDTYTMLFKEIVSRPHLVALDPSRQGDYADYFVRYLEVGQAAGEVPRDADLALLAETIRDLWGGAATHWFMEGATGSLEARVLKRVDLLFDLLGAAAG